MAGEAFIVVDMLKGFLVEGYPLYCGDEARKIIPRVVSLLSDSKDGKIIYVCDNHSEDDLEFEMFPRHCVKGTEEAEIIDELIASRHSERQGRVIDHDQSGSMEKKKQEGYF